MINQQLSILVLDDHPAQRMATLLQLATLGYRNTCEAANGAAALEQLDRLEALDIVVCDIRMSRMDGIEFLRRLATHRLRPAILICSAVEQSLRRSVLFLAGQLGLPILGDIGKPIPMPFFSKLLQRHAVRHVAPAAAPLAAAGSAAAAVTAADFSVCYQPQYALHTLDITGVDIRCCRPDPLLGLQSGCESLQLLSAEQRYGVIQKITEHGLRFISTLQRRDLPLNVAIPLADVQLQSGGLVAMIQGYLQRYHLSPASLSLVVAAADFMQASLGAMENLIRLRLQGCHLTLHVDPANLAALHRLHELPFDQIKLDASHISQDAESRIDIGAVIGCATPLGIQVLVEGIRNWQQNQQLLYLGCQVGMGEWFSPAMNEHAFSHWISPALKQRSSYH